jgi:hypothetical protein
MASLREVIDSIGVKTAADACQVSVRAVYKWRKTNALPHTDYSGVTQHAAYLSKASSGSFSTAEILLCGRPKPVNA